MSSSLPLTILTSIIGAASRIVCVSVTAQDPIRTKKIKFTAPPRKNPLIRVKSAHLGRAHGHTLPLARSPHASPIHLKIVRFYGCNIHGRASKRIRLFSNPVTNLQHSCRVRRGLPWAASSNGIAGLSRITLPTWRPLMLSRAALPDSLERSTILRIAVHNNSICTWSSGMLLLVLG